jgi:hypothetical protein
LFNEIEQPTELHDLELIVAEEEYLVEAGEAQNFLITVEIY